MSKNFPCLKGIADDEIACVVAHPDDEAVFVHLLCSRPGVHMVHVTDGGPMDSRHWQGHSRTDYVTLRQSELDRSLTAAGHTGTRTQLGYIDGTLAGHVLELAQKLRLLFLNRSIRACFTHAYEGGHPDHDAIALAVAIAARQLPWVVKVIEAPLYRMSDDREAGLLWQSFVPADDDKPILVELNEEERVRKQKMFAAHWTQRAVFPHISISQEFYRIAPAYDFSMLPNHGNVSEFWQQTGIDQTKWSGIFRDVLEHM